EALGAERVVLCGLSMGGWNSLLYAAEHPERVERIILVDIGPEASQEWRRSSMTRPPIPTEFRNLDDAFTWARQGNPWASNERLRRDLQDRLRRHGDGRWRWKADPVLAATRLRDMEDPAIIARYWRALETIPCPILEVRGRESLLLSDDILRRMKAAARQLEWVDVPGAGHVVPVDKPQEFIGATRAFLGV
ncbi:MAG: alpha/beta hydrolase, partial [Chloroflexi bacterium]|nr:alpha/beta hydrolase [Chloroflexota bacterium]